MMRGRVGVDRRKEKDKKESKGAGSAVPWSKQGGSTVKGGKWCKMGIRVGRGTRGR